MFRTPHVSCNVVRAVAGTVRTACDKVYVENNGIMDGCEELIFEWLIFVAGVVDVSETATTRSRETLQQNEISRTIQKTLVLKSSVKLLEIPTREEIST